MKTTIDSAVMTKDEIAQSGNSAADELLNLYNTQWDHNIERVYRDFAF